MENTKYKAVTAFLLMIFNWTDHSCSAPTTEETCKPASDLIFILDGGMYIDFATAIVADYSSHHIPDYAVRVGLVLCEEESVHYLPLQSGMSDVADKFKSIKHIYTDRTNITMSTQFSSLSFLSQTNDSCLVVARAMFLNPVRDDVSKMAMFVTNGELWNTTTNVKDVEGLKDDNITVVTVAVDVRDIDTLNDLMTIATDEGTCFVVKDSTSLSVFAVDLSRGTCEPITLKLKYPERSVETTTPVAGKKKTKSDSCNLRKTGTNTYERLIHIPEFGYLVDEEMKCPGTKQFDQKKCECVYL